MKSIPSFRFRFLLFCIAFAVLLFNLQFIQNSYYSFFVEKKKTAHQLQTPRHIRKIQTSKVGDAIVMYHLPLNRDSNVKSKTIWTEFHRWIKENGEKNGATEREWTDKSVRVCPSNMRQKKKRKSFNDSHLTDARWSSFDVKMNGNEQFFSSFLFWCAFLYDVIPIASLKACWKSPF